MAFRIQFGTPLSEEEDTESPESSNGSPQDFVCFVSQVEKADLKDAYGLLGIAHLAGTATEQQLKKAYRQVSLAYHPDKRQGEESSDVRFKAIQWAYETLTDSRKRYIYDSDIPFDDSIPTAEEIKTSDFFQVFAPVFARNAIWSVSKPVPDLGDSQAPWEQVNAFYDFWLAFSSWREFPVEDDYELDEFAGREERRWVERQRARLQAQSKKMEAIRIRSLVDLAMKNDPRVIAYRQQQKERKLAFKRAKEEAKLREVELKKQKELEQAREAEAERLRLEEARLRKKLEKESEKSLQKKLRRRFRSTVEKENLESVDVGLLSLNPTSDLFLVGFSFEEAFFAF
jgi:DnaJ family protein C protein 2